MSIVNRAGERIYLNPQADQIRPVRSGEVKARNFLWLRMQRKLDLTVRELAKVVGRPTATVHQGLIWALAEEERQEQADIAAEQPPILDETSGLDLDDLCFLVGEYPPGTTVGDNPDVRRFFDRMVRRIEAMGYDIQPLAVVLNRAA